MVLDVHFQQLIYDDIVISITATVGVYLNLGEYWSYHDLWSCRFVIIGP